MKSKSRHIKLDTRRKPTSEKAREKRETQAEELRRLMRASAKLTFQAARAMEVASECAHVSKHDKECINRAFRALYDRGNYAKANEAMRDCEHYLQTQIVSVSGAINALLTIEREIERALRLED